MRRIYLFLISLLMLSGISYSTIAQTASITIAYPSIVQGDSIVFEFANPNFSATDKIAIYPEGTLPSAENPAIDSKYIPASTGSVTFKTTLEIGSYVAYLLCCDGYDNLASVSFEIVDPTTAFVNPKKIDFDAGETLEFYYNDPAFAAGDYIAIYTFGEPATGPSITYSNVVSQWGIVSFPGVLAPGYYYAVLMNSSNNVYTQSDPFSVPEGTVGSYVKTAANVYPLLTPIMVNFKDENFSNTDWIGIYKKGELPGGPQSLEWHYAPSDSGTIEFNALLAGDYVVFLLCCDGYEVKARYDFKVAGANTSSLVLNAFTYEVGEPIEFTFNDPSVASGSTTEWIGIYYKGDIPSDVRSIIWDYITVANGKMTFSVPYPNGTWPEEQPDVPLAAGEYFAGLFCCDTYGVLASTTFTVKDKGTGVNSELSSNNKLSLYPNPTNGKVDIKIANSDKLRRIVVYNLTGQVLFNEQVSGFVSQKLIDLKHLGKGAYLVEAMTDQYKLSKKLIIK